MEVPNEGATLVTGEGIHRPPDFSEDRQPTKEGVPTDGKAAHLKGFSIVDNPYTSDEEDDYVRWEEEWEASAEESSTQEVETEPEPQAHSVVKSKYRAKYAEEGHPQHCGDELADTLNRLCIVAKKTDMGLLCAILDENGVKYDKYKRTGQGWEGRFRMTTRNILAKEVWRAKGLLRLPETIDGGEPVQLSEEWVAGQRFKA
jgi:hypothetical protein